MTQGSDSGERNAAKKAEFLTIDRVLQTVGGILLAIIGHMTWGIQDKVERHDREIVEMRAKADADKQAADKFEIQVQRNSDELRSELRRMSEKIDRISEAVGAKRP
ncbi:MAG: hypothetical protein WC100_03380 [Sterolibacterium sp.]